MGKVIAYVDGFNVYHAINNNLEARYKWLDYRKFVEHFLSDEDELVDILFFTAPPRWDESRIQRHHAYIDILKKGLNVHIVSGNYTSVERKFNAEKMPLISPKNATVSPRKFSYATFEEKQTDVNIALSILEGGLLDLYDTALIFSGDSDIAPAIYRVKKYKKDKKFVCILPYNGKGRAMSRACDEHKNTTIQLLEKSLLDDTIYLFGKKYTNPHQKK